MKFIWFTCKNSFIFSFGHTALFTKVRKDGLYACSTGFQVNCDSLGFHVRNCLKSSKLTASISNVKCFEKFNLLYQSLDFTEEDVIFHSEKILKTHICRL